MSQRPFPSANVHGENSAAQLVLSPPQRNEWAFSKQLMPQGKTDHDCSIGIGEPSSSKRKS